MSDLVIYIVAALFFFAGWVLGYIYGSWKKWK